MAGRCRRGCRRALLALLLLSQCGCLAVGDGQAPLSGLWYRAEKNPDATLWVLLPGRYDDVTAFEKHRWIAKARDAGVSADIEVVNAYLNYYLERTVVTRLHEDVIVPARKAGYRHIVLIGVSLGATGAMRYWQQYPAGVDDVVMIAPYLGEPWLLNEIREAGGVRKWRSADCVPGNLCQMWKVLQAQDRDGDLSRRLVLLYGEQDRLVEGHKLLAPLLDERKVVTTRGGHTWFTWGKLWSRALQRDLIKER